MEKIKLEDTFVEKLRFRQQDVDTFAEITGDKNPIHIDADFAANTPFGKPIVHGFLAGAVFSKTFGTQWPGAGSIYMYQEMSFRAPVFVEKDYLAKYKIIELNTEKHRGVIECVLEDTEGNISIIGKAMLKNTNRF